MERTPRRRSLDSRDRTIFLDDLLKKLNAGGQQEYLSRDDDGPAYISGQRSSSRSPPLRDYGIEEYIPPHHSKHPRILRRAC